MKPFWLCLAGKFHDQGLKRKTGSALREDQAGLARCREALQPKNHLVYPAACDPVHPVFPMNRAHCKVFHAFPLLCLAFPLFAELPNIEDWRQDFVLETKRIEIPDFPSAFNPSIVQWNGYILMSFRLIPDPHFPYTSVLGLVLLDENFDPISNPQLFSMREPTSPVPSRVEDARLFYVGENLYIAYSDNPNLQINKAGFRMEIGQIHYEHGLFSIRNVQRLTDYEGESPLLREKSWVPFDYQGNLLLAYSLKPHLIFHPIPETNHCDTVVSTDPWIDWNWGIIRGGTPALLLDTGEYLAFFHSVKKMETVHSKGKEVSHYFMGAYKFSAEFPFQITAFSSEPIVGKGFYSGKAYKPYWGSIQCVFPAGLILDGDTIYISYGRQDHEIWIAKLDKSKLLSSLSSVSGISYLQSQPQVFSGLGAQRPQSSLDE